MKLLIHLLLPIQTACFRWTWWYAYDHDAKVYSVAKNTYVLKTTEGKFAKFQIATFDGQVVKRSGVFLNISTRMTAPLFSANSIRSR